MKYIITSVQKGASVNKKLLANLKTFAKEQGVSNIYTFVMNGRYKDEEFLDPAIGLAGIETISNLSLNKNLRCRDMQVHAQKIHPLQGLNSKLPRDHSHILPATKIRLEFLSNLSKHPRALITTGALTEGNYKENTMIGMKAKEQHQFGFVLVEIKNSRIFDFKQIHVQASGNFHFLDRFYQSGKSYHEQPECVVLGDLHIGITNQKARAESIEMLKELKPKYCVLHDIFDGASVNHHARGSFLTAIKNFQTKKDSLDKELKAVLKEIHFFAKEFPGIKFLVPESNHDVFLRRYIDDKEFFDDAQNWLFVASIVPEILEGKKPVLEIALGKLGKIPGNFRFFLENDEFRVRGVNVASHGHLGVSGSRGTPAQFSRQNFRQMSGHTHKPQILANVYVVGTLSELVQAYMKGPGAHAHCNGIIYQDGHMGLLMIMV